MGPNTSNHPDSPTDPFDVQITHRTDRSQQATPAIGPRRLLNKILHVIARKTPFLPSKLRILLHVFRGVKIPDRRGIFIGENVNLDDLYPHLISIGSFVTLTEGVKVLTHFVEAPDDRNEEHPFRFYKGMVRIESHVFIGANTVIAKPIVVGRGSLIGANSLLVENVPPNSLIVGVPGKQVRELPGIRPLCPPGDAD